MINVLDGGQTCEKLRTSATVIPQNTYEYAWSHVESYNGERLM